MDGSEDRKGVYFLPQRLRMRSVLALLLGLLGLGAVPATTDPLDEISIESVVAEINRHRLDWGLAPLEADHRLHAAAEDRIVDMETVGYWGHQCQCPEGQSPFVWLADHDYRHQIAGENLAAGYETTRLLVQSWMESPGHRANILSSDFAHIGVAWIDGGTTRRLSGRSVVVLFAREMGGEGNEKWKMENEKRHSRQ